jgi:hypothetical protein
MRHVLVAVFVQGGVMRNPNEGLCGQIPNMPLRAITSLYIEHVPPHMEQKRERGQRPNPISSVSCVSSVVLMGRETSSLHLLAPLLLTGGKGADLVIRGNVVLNSSIFEIPCPLFRRVNAHLRVGLEKWLRLDEQAQARCSSARLG